MKLAMATQGDHNALAKLTVQTIMGFGMEMEQAGEVTDKALFIKTITMQRTLAKSSMFPNPINNWMDKAFQEVKPTQLYVGPPPAPSKSQVACHFE